MKNDKELVIEFAKTWNNLDSSYIRDLLTKEFNYTSQWVFDELKNKEDYLAYLDGKLNTIKSSEGELIAEVGIYRDKHCLVINQINNGKTQKVTFLIETKDGEILRADTCMIPTPQSIELLGIIPK